MLPLLARLYGTDLVPRPDAGDAGGPDAPPGRKQGLTSDPKVRKAIELFAEDHAVAFFAERGWQVKRVGQYKLGYDLVCGNLDGAILHVEVKGTRTLGEKVTLTANEVEHVRRAADCGAEHILYVVSEISVTENDSLTCSGGTATRLRPWTINDNDLIATEYTYTVPPSVTSSSS